jgi:hypothetical protein
MTKQCSDTDLGEIQTKIQKKNPGNPNKNHFLFGLSTQKIQNR